MINIDQFGVVECGTILLECDGWPDKTRVQPKDLSFDRRRWTPEDLALNRHKKEVWVGIRGGSV